MFKLPIRPLTVLAVALLGPVLYGTPLLVEEGKARSEILIAKDPPRTVAMAAKDLQLYVKKITGAELPISTVPNPNVPQKIYVGKSPLTDALGLTTDGLQGAGYKIQSGPNWIAFMGLDQNYLPPQLIPESRSEEDMSKFLAAWDKITGDHFGNPYFAIGRKYDSASGLWEMDLDYAGTFNAVSNFLQSLGVRWYFPGDLGEVVPRKSSIAIPQINQVSNPDFILRNLYIHGGHFSAGRQDQILWRMRMGLNEGVAFGFSGTPTVAHGIKYVLSRDEIKKSHPDLYMIKDGQPQLEKGIPRLSSEKLVERQLKYLGHVFDTYDVPMVSVMPTDGFTSAGEDEESQKMVTPERGWFGTLSDYVWTYVDRVAKEIEKTHPDKKIHNLAYTTYLLPPSTIERLPDNVIVGIAYSPAVLHSKSMKEFYQKVRAEWKKKTAPENLLYGYGYYLHGWRNRWPGVPAIYPQIIVEDLRDLKGSYYGAFTEVFATPSNWINAYITSKFYWDVEQNLEAMMDEYYALFYGPAKNEMRKFIEFCEANWMNFSKDATLIDQAFQKIEAASAATSASPYKERIQLFVDFMQPMKARKAELLAKEQNAKRVTGRLLDSATVSVDGKLDEKFWSELPTYSLTPIDPSAVKSPVKTEVKFGWVNNELLIGIKCEEPSMKNVGGLDRNDDASIFNYDSVEIVLETPTHSHYQIAVSALGGVIDVDRSETINTLWSAGAEIKVYRNTDAWFVEAKIPVVESSDGDVDILNGVMGNQPSTENPWYINIGRLRINEGQRETFSLSGKGFHDKLNFARFTLEDN